MSHSDIDPKLEEIANKFVTKVKAGKEKISSGFGGKGLDNLQEVRDNKLKLENKDLVINNHNANKRKRRRKTE